MKKILSLYLLLFLFLADNPSISQNTFKGRPFMDVYVDREDYIGHAQNWDITQDYRGVVWFANNDGLLSYDGKNWNMFNTGEKSTMRSVLADSTILYCSSYHEFGFFETDASGNKSYISLSDSANDETYYDVWKIIKTDKGVYFLASDSLIFRWHNSQLTSIGFESLLKFFYAFQVGEELWLVSMEKGLCRLNGSHRSF